MRRNSIYLHLMILAGWLGLLILCMSPARAAKNTSPGAKKEDNAKTKSGTFISMEGVKADYPKIDWVEVKYDSPGDRKIHLCNPKQKITAFDWTPGKDIFQSFGNPPYASYKYDKATETETFQVYGNRSNRSEVRLYNEYEFGATQFEGYVTFYPPTDDECLMQIWGSDEGATQLMVRAYGDKNGSIGINFKGSGTPKVLHDLYGKETKVNVIHLQEDMGNKIMVFLDDKKVAEYPDNEKAVNHNNKNYHKWGLYGTVKPGHENPMVVWRKVRHYAAGAAVPETKNTQPKKPGHASMMGAANKETTAERQMETTPAAQSETGLPKSLRAALLPAVKNGGFSNEGHILWCPSVIKIGDTYHMFCSRWPDQYDMGGWTRYSECVHATSKDLCGPYEFKEVVLQKRPDNWDNTRVHNPKIVKAGDTYVIYYIDTANETGFAYSKSIDGPWTRLNQPVMKVSNPAIYVKPDNSIYVFGRLGVNGRNRAIAFSAPTFKGPYTLLRNGENLLPDDSFTLEDPTIWWANDQYNVLLNDFSGTATGTKKGGAQFFSKDGLHYTLVSRDPVFTKEIVYNDGSTEIVNRRERPFVYANEKGEALALFTACYYKTPEGKMSAKIVANPIDHYVPNNLAIPRQGGCAGIVPRRRMQRQDGAGHGGKVDTLIPVVALELAGPAEASREQYVLNGCRQTLETGVAQAQGCELKPMRWMEKFGDWKHAECLGGWQGGQSSASWQFRTAEPGSFYLDVEYTCPTGDDYSEWRVRCGDTDLTFPLIDTGERDKRQAFGGALPRLRTYRVGMIDFPQAGEQRLTLGPTGPSGKGVRISALTVSPIQ